MTTLNAFSFFLLGLVMVFVPVVMPQFFAADAMDGSSTSALWLGVMGLFQSVMGTVFIVRNEALPLAVRLMTFRLPTFQRQRSEERTPAHALILRPIRGNFAGNQSRDSQRVAA